MSGAPVLVTGGCGFIGSNLVDRLAREGHAVTILDCLARPGVEHNLAWLLSRHGQQITFHRGDVRDRAAVGRAATGVSAAFHLAAQVAVTTSLHDPRDDFEVNIQGTLNVLEELRAQDRAIPIVFASTNKVYGDLADIDLELVGEAYRPVSADVRDHGVNESRSLDFHTPYGCSKGAADQYVLDYARSFGLPTAVMRMSCIYGPHQMGTEDQGWVAHFIIKALRGEPLTLFGDGLQVRDVLHVDDAVDAYLAAWRRMSDASGQAFNLGGGPRNTISLLELIRFIEEQIGAPVGRSHADWRAGDQRYYVSDTRRAASTLGLGPARPWREGVADLIAWLRSESPLLAGSRLTAAAE